VAWAPSVTMAILSACGALGSNSLPAGYGLHKHEGRVRGREGFGGGTRLPDWEKDHCMCKGRIGHRFEAGCGLLGSDMEDLGFGVWGFEV
jgi:hypothetical protein